MKLLIFETCHVSLNLLILGVKKICRLFLFLTQQIHGHLNCWDISWGYPQMIKLVLYLVVPFKSIQDNYAANLDFFFGCKKLKKLKVKLASRNLPQLHTNRLSFVSANTYTPEIQHRYQINMFLFDNVWSSFQIWLLWVRILDFMSL